MNRSVTVLWSLLLLGWAALATADIIHTEKSLYRNILVDQEGTLICLKFSLRLHNPQNQSCLDREHPEHLIFDYTRKAMGSLFVHPAPKRMLVIGLGGGTLPTLYAQLFPSLSIDVVEVDEAVVRVARTYFGFITNDRLKVIIDDGRLFVKKAGRRGEKYDLIMLDAFNGEYIPEHMMTQEFLREVKVLMSENGLVVANTFSSSRLYAHESVTYESVFGPFINIAGPGQGNRVILASADGHFPSQEALKTEAMMQRARFARLGIDSLALLSRFSRERDWDISARPLSDQYSPANLMNDL